MPLVHLPKTLVSDIRVEVLSESGEWECAASVKNNRRRVVYLKINKRVKAIRVIPEKSYGNDEIKIFTLDAR